MERKHIEAIGHALDAVWQATEGDYMTAAVHATEALLGLISEDDARAMLDAVARRRANAVADAAELAKFGAGEP